MGYAYYEIYRPGQPYTTNQKPMKRGYAISCKCHAYGCQERIDRGMAYLCYSCTWYFCEKHRTMAFCEHDEAIENECFVGESSQVCLICCKWLEKHAECSHEETA